MELSPTEQILLESIRTCKRLAFYEQARWIFAQKKVEGVHLTNSVKAAFSRAKKSLVEAGKISEYNLLPIELSDEDYIDFAAHVAPSDELKELRLRFLPKIFAAISTREEGDRLITAESEIFSPYWNKYKINEDSIREKRDRLKKIVSRIFRLLAPMYSKLRGKYKDKFSVRDLDILFAFAALNEHGEHVFFGKKSYLSLFRSIKESLLDDLDDKVLLLIFEYEREVESFSNFVLGHRRRVIISEKVRTFRIHKRWRRESDKWSPVKLAIEETYKTEALEEFGLSIKDFDFMMRKFAELSYGELVIMLNEVLAIPEREVTVLQENHRSGFV